MSIARLRGTATGVQFHPNGQFVLVTLRDGLEVRVAASGERVWSAALRFEGIAAFAEGGRSVLAVESSSDDWNDRSLVRVTEGSRDRIGPALRLLGTSPDGTKALLYGDRLSVATVDLETLDVVPFSASNANPLSGTLSNDGRRTLHLIAIPMIVGWTVPKTAALLIESGGPFALHPSGTHLVHPTPDGDGMVVLEWDRKKTRPAPRARGGHLYALGWSGDGALLHASGIGTTIWREDGRELCHLGHTGYGNSASTVFHGAFSRDGRRFASVTSGGDLFVWDLPG